MQVRITRTFAMSDLCASVFDVAGYVALWQQGKRKLGIARCPSNINNGNLASGSGSLVFSVEFHHPVVFSGTE